MSDSIHLPTLALELPGATFVGPAMNDMSLAEQVPLDLFAVLVDVNGFVVFEGAFHLRGICAGPEWHSLDEAWRGDRAIHRQFPAVERSDIPFAQDALGNQFLLRDESVWLLAAETAELRPLELDFQDLLRSFIERPDDLLPTDMIRQFESGGELLHPGQLLSVYPPLCAQESAAGVSLLAVPALERIAFLSEFAAQIAGSANGARIRIVVEKNGAS